MYSFRSRFAEDICGMMKWRGTLGYTESCYEPQLRNFDDFCIDTFPNEAILTWDIALAYLNEYRKRRDIRVDVAALRNLGKYQVMIGKNACIFPANYFGYKKRKLPYIMTTEDLQRLFDASDYFPEDNADPLLAYTVAVFFRLQYSTGMRPSETRKLTRQDFDFVHGTIYIADSKKHKDRCIAVDAKIMDMCKKYDSIARSIYPETNIFFPNKNQQMHSSTSIQKIFKKCWKLAGNPEGLEYCTPYILRHNFATRRITQWMEDGKDFEQFIPYLSAYMGHQTFRDTIYYLHLLPERLRTMAFMDISDVVAEVQDEK